MDASGNPAIDRQLLFLGALFTPSNDVCLRPIETYDESGKRGSRVIYSEIRYPRAEVFSLRHSLQRLNKIAAKEKANLFFGVCPRFGGAGKYDQAFQVRQVNSLWADIDNCDPTTALDKIAAAGMPPPSMLVNSGNGVHVYYVLTEPYLIDDCPPPPAVLTDWVEGIGGRKPIKFYLEAGTKIELGPGSRMAPKLSPKAQRIQDICQGMAHAVGGDSTHDLSRLLRLPESMNRKNERNGKEPRPCSLVVFESDRKYAVEQFAKLAESAPAVQQRRKAAAVQLPPFLPDIKDRQRDKLNRFINLSAVSDPGTRSEADFNLLTFAIRNRMPRYAVWELVNGVGKFGERGERYFIRTWEAAAEAVQFETLRQIEGHQEQKRTKAAKAESAPVGPPPPGGTDGAVGEPPEETGPITNAVIEIGDDGEKRIQPLTMKEICEGVFKRTGNWPRRVAEALFVHDQKDGIAWLTNPPALFGWLANHAGNVEWHRQIGCPTKEEVFHEFCRMAKCYRAVETMPHEPAVADHYYACTFPDSGDGEHITQLVDRFSPETEVDRQLILAMLATLFWGGKGGQRPLFVVTGVGRGIGKTKLTEVAAELVGGLLDVSPNEDAGIMKQRLLSPDALDKRIVRLDNVKSLKFSWAELESMITSKEISGKRMYVGNASRPNLMTWLVTLNGISLGTDIADRSVVIRVAKPRYDGAWADETLEYVERHRAAIVADLMGFLRLPKQEVKNTRWGSWENEVLGRLQVEAGEVQKVIIERRSTSDVEAEEIELLEEFFGQKLEGLGYDLVAGKVHITSDVAASWYNHALNEKRTVIASCRILTQFCEEGRTKSLRRNTSKKYGRGFVWCGSESNEGTYVDYDLEDKIHAEKTDRSDDYKNKQFKW